MPLVLPLLVACTFLYTLPAFSIGEAGSNAGGGGSTAGNNVAAKPVLEAGTAPPGVQVMGPDGAK